VSCSRRHRARSHGRGRLFWRVYLNGLALLALVALALGAVGWVYGGRGPGPRPERFAEYAASQVAGGLGSPDRLAEGLEHARDAFGAELAVYEGERLLASNMAEPPPPLPPAERDRAAQGALRLPGRGWRYAAPVPGAAGTYVVLSHRWRPFSFPRAATLVGAVLLALALASIPLARAIAAPLERLTGAARRLGEGDLSARAGFRGRGEVGELAGAFDEMAERLERLITAERELLANVSHELRTPLSRIRVALDLAAEGDGERARRYLAEIGTDLSELERLVEDVLAAARLEREGGALPLRLARVASREVLGAASERFRAAAPGRELDLRLEGELPEIEADPALLRRAIDNLLDNARKYSDEGAPVTLRARRDGGELVVEVRDRGIGIDAADLPRLFTPFFRTDRSRARGTGGVGLGLALAKRIVGAHGGSIEVESGVGEGTVVRFRLPA